MGTAIIQGPGSGQGEMYTVWICFDPAHQRHADGLEVDHERKKEGSWLSFWRINLLSPEIKKVAMEQVE